MHLIHVSVMSPEEASFGVAELWSGTPSGTRLIGVTMYDDGDLMLRIEPRDDGTPVVVGVHALVEALAEAGRRLALA
jgi:hypothetical protein